MTKIQASCPGCGEVTLTSSDIELKVCSHAPLSYYAFNCPKCQDRIQKPADDHVISLLMSGGVRALVWDVPAEALERHEGPLFTHDDILDFHKEMEEARDISACRGVYPWGGGGHVQG